MQGRIDRLIANWMVGRTQGWMVFSVIEGGRMDDGWKDDRIIKEVDGRVYERINRWMAENEWINGWISKCHVIVWMDKWTEEWCVMHRKKDEWMDQLMERLTDWLMDGWIPWWMDGWTAEWMTNALLDVWPNGWLREADQWASGWRSCSVIECGTDAWIIRWWRDRGMEGWIDEQLDKL